MENFDKYIQLLLTKDLEKKDNELSTNSCKKDLNLLVLRKKLLYLRSKKFVLKEDAIMP